MSADLSNYLIAFVLGAPGSGKGTQCQRIVDQFQWKHLSTGDLLRNEVAAGTDLGLQCQELMNEGKMVPVEVILDLLVNAMLASDNKKFLIDGFPRTMEQFEQFKDKVRVADAVLVFSVSDEVAQERLLGRAATSGRADDNAETILKRMGVYKGESVPVIEALRSHAGFIEIDASAAPDQVFQQVVPLLEQLEQKAAQPPLQGDEQAVLDGSAEVADVIQPSREAGEEGPAEEPDAKGADAEEAPGAEAGDELAGAPGDAGEPGADAGAAGDGADLAEAGAAAGDDGAAAADGVDAAADGVDAVQSEPLAEGDMSEVRRRDAVQSEPLAEGDMSEAEMKSIVKIQAGVRGHMARKQVANMRQELSSAAEGEERGQVLGEEAAAEEAGPEETGEEAAAAGATGAEEAAPEEAPAGEAAAEEAAAEEALPEGAQAAAGEAAEEAPAMADEGNNALPPPTEEEYTEDEINSLVKIQAGVRGHLARKQVAALKEQEAAEGATEEANGVAEPVEQEAEGHADAVEAAADAGAELAGADAGEEYTQDEINSLVKIQAGVRGHLARKQVAALKEQEAAGPPAQEQAEAGEAAAVEDDAAGGDDVQAQENGGEEYTQDEINSLVKIQAGVRGHLARKQVAALKEQEAAEGATEEANGVAEPGAADVEPVDPEGEAAAEAGAAGAEEGVELAGADAGEEYTQDEINSLVKIQAGVRGHLARKQVAALKEQEAAPAPAQEQAGGAEAADVPVDEYPQGDTAEEGSVLPPVAKPAAVPAAPLDPVRGPLVLCGPSGVGKGSLISRLMADYPDHFGFCTSHTTRAPRPGEVDGQHYHFAQRSAMEADIAAGLFLEHAAVHGNLYGTSLRAVRDVSTQGKTCVLDIDVQGARKVRGSVLASSAVCVFISPPSMAQLEQRLRGRGTESEAAISTRLANAAGEMEVADEPGLFNARIVNDELSEAYAQLKATIRRLLPGSLPDEPEVAPKPKAEPPPSIAQAPPAEAPVQAAAAPAPAPAPSAPASYTSLVKPGLPVRQYLDATVVPTLKELMREVNSVRPADSLQFMIDFLVAKKRAVQPPDV